VDDVEQVVFGFMSRLANSIQNNLHRIDQNFLEMTDDDLEQCREKEHGEYRVSANPIYTCRPCYDKLHALPSENHHEAEETHSLTLDELMGDFLA
jgi:hypothetical protein